MGSGSGSFLKVVVKNLDVLAGLPFWSYAKLFFNCWLVLPYFNGAAHVYEHFVRPMIVNQQVVNIWYIPRKDDSSRPDDVNFTMLVCENGGKLATVFICAVRTIAMCLYSDVEDFKHKALNLGGRGGGKESQG